MRAATKALAVLGIALAGCTAQQAAQTSPAASPTPAAAPPGEEIAAAASPVPTTMPTPTLLLSPTSVPTAVDTATPMPTFTAEQTQAVVVDMLKTNGGCDLPCWWGITPGQTPRQEAWAFFSQFGGSKRDRLFSISYGGKSDYHVGIQWSESNEFIQSIRVSSGVVGAYSSTHFVRDWEFHAVVNVLSRHGCPSRILVQFTPAIEEGARRGYALVLVYDHLGFYVHYSGTAVHEPPVLRPCPGRQVGAISLVLQQPGQLEVDEGIIRHFYPIEEATGITVDGFYEMFRDVGSDACFGQSGWPED